MVLTKRKLKELIQLERGSDLDSRKTAMMFKLERKYQRSIIELLDASESGKVLGDRYGVTEGCISRWRKRFGIVPIHGKCKNCNNYFPSSYKECPHCRQVV